MLLTFATCGYSQTTYDWFDTAPDGNWRQGASGARWTGGLFNEPPFGILRFNNNHRLAMNNNVPPTYGQHMIIFGTSNNIVRTISLKAMRFFDFNFNNPKIENFSNANHIFNIEINGDGDAADPLEINLLGTAGLTFNGLTNNQGSFINIFGTNSQTASFNGIVTGAGGFGVNQGNILLLNNTNTYAGNTEINRGELWINTSGDAIANNNNIFIGNVGSTADVCKIFLSRPAGGTTFTRNFTVNTGNQSTRFIGSLNTSRINEFSGVITNNSDTHGLRAEVVNSGGTLRCSNIINGAGSITKIGPGTLEFSGTGKTYTGNTVIDNGTFRLGSANQIADGSSLQLNGGTFTTGSSLGFSETMGILQLSGTSNSTLALSTGAHTIRFAASNVSSWTTGRTLTITGWSNVCHGNIFVGAANTALTSAQLGQITFSGFTAGARITNSGQLLPASYTTISGSSAGTQNICAVTQPTTLTLSGHTGTITKWQKSTDITFASGVIDIAITTTTLTGAEVGVVSATTYVRAELQQGSCEIFYSPTITLTVKSETFNGTGNWTNGAVGTTIRESAIINANYNTTTNGLLNACSVVINAPFILTIKANEYVNLINNLTVASGASVIIENNGSLVQVNNSAVNTGNINYSRITNVKQYDVVYWSTPVAGQNISVLPQQSANTLWQWNTTATNFNDDNNFGRWEGASGTMTNAKGYAARVPNGTSALTAVPLTAAFLGVPNNGLVSIEVSRASNTTLVRIGSNGADFTNFDDNWNLIGNPYPSAIDANAFLDQNFDLEGSVHV